MMKSSLIFAVLLPSFALLVFLPLSADAELCSWDKLDQKELEQSWIGEKTDEGYSKNGGFFRHYENTQFPDLKASIYCSSEAGTHIISGKIRDEWFSHGKENGLGYPITDVTNLRMPHQDGIFAEFQGGLILFKKGVGTRIIFSGPILDKWKSVGAESVLGLPTGDYNNTPGADGFYQTFQNGIIVWEQGKSAAYALNGKYFDEWYKKSYVFRDSGEIGFPTSDGLDPNAIIQDEPKGHFAISYSGVHLSAFFSKPPSIDGNIESEEWKNADIEKFRVASGANEFRGIIYTMRDQDNLYIALRLNEPVLEDRIIEIFFDNEHNGQRDVGDDIISYGSFFSDMSIVEINSNTYGWSGAEEEPNVMATATNHGVYNHYEFAHPLCSTDKDHDFCIEIGDVIGFQIVYTKNKRAVAWPNWGEIKITQNNENKLAAPFKANNIPLTIIQTPLEQFRSSKSVEGIVCDNNYTLIIKSSRNSAACFESETAIKIIERGWGTLPKSKFLVSLENAFPTASIIVKGEGFDQNADYQIFFDDIILNSVKTDSLGKFTSLVFVPEDIDLGEYHLRIVNESGISKDSIIKIVTKDNLRQKKFDAGFYEKIINMIKSGETRPYGVIIIVGEENKDILETLLLKVHNATNVYKAGILSFVTATVPTQEIPEIADYNFVGQMGDGELPVVSEEPGHLGELINE